jgi:hypothetical protein
MNYEDMCNQRIFLLNLLTKDMALYVKGKKRTIKSLDEVLGFGMYKDKTVKEVLESNKSYLEWMHTFTNNKLGKRLIKEIEALDEKYVGLFN